MLWRGLLALSLVGWLVAVGSPAAAQDREGALGVLALDPDERGDYALPTASGEPLPLEYDPGESPFRLLELELDAERKSVLATFQNRDERPVSAWAVELATVSASGETIGSVTLTHDASDAAEPGTGSLREKAVSPPFHEEGLLLPGQMVRVPGLSVGGPGTNRARRPARLVLTVPVVVFEDTSFVGSAGLARKILGDRKAAAEELAYWSVRLEELAERAESNAEALAGLKALRAELDPGTPDLSHPVQAVRANLRTNLESVLRSAKLRPESARNELSSLSAWLAAKLERKARHVPRELPDAPGGTAQDGRLEERAFGEEEELPTCECGGSIYTSVAQSETRNCPTSTGWRVNEAWSYTCLSDDQSTLNTGSGMLTGIGGCIEGVICVPNTYCPPQFSPPFVTEDLDNNIWTRSVVHQKALVGACTARCDSNGSSSLTLKCSCYPPTAPRCRTDGCPILIETGAAGFQLTDLAGGVRFDLDADGEAERLSWPVAGTDDAWLALDRNGNGSIDDGLELFGDSTPQPPSGEPNGFLALAVFDRPEEGGDGDGQITAADRVFSDLLLWVDADHDGVSDPSELTGLGAAGIVALELEYHESRRRDAHGNEFRFQAGVWHASGARRLAQDVFLLYE